MKTLFKITIFLTMFLTSFLLHAQYNAGTNSGTNGGSHTFVGVNAGKVNTGTNNTFYGTNAGLSNTTGAYNSFFGTNTGYLNTTGSSNTFIGQAAGRFNTTGKENSFIGRGTGYNNTTGVSNVFVGMYSGYANTTAAYNTFIGERAGRFNTTARYGTFIGRRAGYSNTTGNYNSFIGANAGYRNTTGTFNSFLGVNTGYDNTIGTYNTFIGQAAGRLNTSGNGNTFIGFNAGYDVKTSSYNTMIGYRAGYNAVGGGNVFLGRNAGYNESGNDKLYIDNSSTANPLIKGDFTANTLTFNGDVGVGEAIPTGGAVPTDISLYVKGRFAQEFSGTIGSFGSSDRWSSLGTSFAPNGTIPLVYGMINQWGDNSFISGVKDGTASAVVWTGPNARLDFDYFNTSNFTAQTYMSVLSNGRVGIGTTNPGSYKLYVSGSAFATGSWNSSDKRYKEDIKTIGSALDKINALDGVSYQFKQKTINDIDFSKLKQGNHLGFIAQDLERVFPELVRKDDAGYYAVNYDGLIPVLVEGIKEQQNVIDEQEEEMLKQQEEILDLQSRMDKLENLLNSTGSNLNSSPIINDFTIAGVMLRQNAPNPFSDKTTIEYQLPDKLKVASLVIYDLNGRSIATYGISNKGSIDFNANGLSNGTYAYAIIANGKSIATQKMIIQK